MHAATGNGLSVRASSESLSVSAKYAWPCSWTNTPRRVSSFIVRVAVLMSQCADEAVKNLDDMLTQLERRQPGE